MHFPESDCDSVCRLIIAIFAGIYLTVAFILAIYFLRDSSFNGPKVCSGFCAFMVSFTLSLMILPLFLIYLAIWSPMLLVEYLNRKRLERTSHVHPDPETEQGNTEKTDTKATDGETRSTDAKENVNTYTTESDDAKESNSGDVTESSCGDVTKNESDDKKESKSDDAKGNKSDDAKETGSAEAEGAKNAYTESSGLTVDDSSPTGLTSVVPV